MPKAFPQLGLREQRGSRPRCVLLTEGSPPEVTARLAELSDGHASVDADRDYWRPRGLADPGEARLGATRGFLSTEQDGILLRWWLVHAQGATTPHWDILSTATIEGRHGLLMVEAKAHASEIKTDGKPPGNQENGVRIAAAIAEANAGLNKSLPGWSLSCDSHYQLANRFAFAWKVASLGVAVVLVYLGFLNARDMADQGPCFLTAESWAQVVMAHARGIVPEAAWHTRLDVDGTPLRVVIAARQDPLRKVVCDGED